MGICSGDEDCPVLESTERVKTGRAKKYTSNKHFLAFTPLRHHISEKWYGNSWKDVDLVLYSDTVLAWYDDAGEMIGGAKLVNSPDLIAAGQFTKNIPDRPELAPGHSEAGLMAVGVRPGSVVHWLLVSGEGEVQDWMKAMSSVITPLIPQQQQQQPGVQQPVQPPPPYQPHLPPAPQQHYPTAPQQPGYPRHPAPPPPRGGGYPQQQGGHYHGHHGGGGGGTTVIYADGGRGRRDSGPGFGTGMLAGGLLGYGMGGGFGHGFGFGGFGWGGGFGHHGGWGGGYHNNETINTETHETNNTTINNYYGDEQQGDIPGGVPEDQYDQGYGGDEGGYGEEEYHDDGGEDWGGGFDDGGGDFGGDFDGGDFGGDF